MYIPPYFRVDDKDTMFEFIETGCKITIDRLEGKWKLRCSRSSLTGTLFVLRCESILLFLSAGNRLSRWGHIAMDVRGFSQ